MWCKACDTIVKHHEKRVKNVRTHSRKEVLTITVMDSAKFLASHIDVTFFGFSLYEVNIQTEFFNLLEFHFHKLKTK